MDLYLKIVFFAIIALIFKMTISASKEKNTSLTELKEMERQQKLQNWIQEEVEKTLTKYREITKGYNVENAKNTITNYLDTRFKVFIQDEKLCIFAESEEYIKESLEKRMNQIDSNIEYYRDKTYERSYKFFSEETREEEVEEKVSSLLEYYIIPLNKIRYYRQSGQISYHTEIYGGGGGGSSLGGALLGGLIGGEAGAIIGSRRESDPIRSREVENDNRSTSLHYTTENNEDGSIWFNYYDYNTFEKLIPDKSYEIVKERKKLELLADQYKEVKKLQEESMSKDLTNQTNDAGNKTNPEEDITTQIEKLFQLKEKGILTEDEFIEKKRELLSKI